MITNNNIYIAYDNNIWHTGSYPNNTILNTIISIIAHKLM